MCTECKDTFYMEEEYLQNILDKHSGEDAKIDETPTKSEIEAMNPEASKKESC